MMEIKHVFQHNPCEVSFEVDVRLIEKPGLYPYRMDEYNIYPTLAKKLFLIDGVVGVDIGIRSILIKKAKVFLWSEMFAAIHEVIRSCIAGDLDDLTPLGFDAEKYDQVMVREYYLNPNMMTIHVGQRLTDRITYEQEHNNSLKIIKNLLAVEGVENAYLDQYSINISKVSMSEWSNINAQVDEIVADFLISSLVYRKSFCQKMTDCGYQSSSVDCETTT